MARLTFALQQADLEPSYLAILNVKSRFQNHTGYYSAEQRNEPLLHARTWMNLTVIMTRKRSQKRVYTWCDLIGMIYSFDKILENMNSQIVTESISSCQRWGGAGGREGMEFILFIGMMVFQVYPDVKIIKFYTLNACIFCTSITS